MASCSKTPDNLDEYKLTNVKPILTKCKLSKMNSNVYTFLAKDGNVSWNQYDVFDYIKSIDSEDDFITTWVKALDITNAHTDVKNYKIKPSRLYKPFNFIMKQTAFTMSKIAVKSPFAFSVVDENGAKRWMISTDDEFEKKVDMKYMKTKSIEMMRYNLESNWTLFSA